MKLYWKRPTAIALKEGLTAQLSLPFSYAEVGHATHADFPPGYDHDRNRCYLGNGPAVLAVARDLIREYAHFPRHWAFVHATGPPDPNLPVVTTFYQFGLWWLNGLRIIAVIDRPDYYGFSYGTLTSHIERGEELFYAKMEADDKVYYGINAFSWPRFWGARLLKPYARNQQRRFIRDSMTGMQRQVTERLLSTIKV
ncbi:MAG: DUF1990 domain-containing protein [Bacteroidota bacterium]